jgi:hypothetical protein
LGQKAEGNLMGIFRILQNGCKEFRVQRRVLFIFWKDEVHYWKDDRDGSSHSTRIFNDFNQAKNWVEKRERDLSRKRWAVVG